MLSQIDIGEKFGSPFGQVGGKTLGDLISVILQAAFALASVIFIFLLVFGGISIIAGAGSENPEQAAKGKQAVSSALIGFVVVFAAYWIVRLIEEILGVRFITEPGI